MILRVVVLVCLLFLVGGLVGCRGSYYHGLAVDRSGGGLGNDGVCCLY